jgi:ABC-type uncharacterized transport system substrate-binding protein
MQERRSEAGYRVRKNTGPRHRPRAEGHDDRLSALAADLVARQVNLIVGNTPGALAAKTATSSIPIIFHSGADPIKVGLVASLNRPGGNVTGVTFLSALLEAKRLGLLHEMAPKTTIIAALVNPNFPAAMDQLRFIREAALKLGQQIYPLNASQERELEAGFAIIPEKRTDALVVAADAFLVDQRQQIVALAARYACRGFQRISC